jgi:hypothetical protein
MVHNIVEKEFLNGKTGNQTLQDRTLEASVAKIVHSDGCWDRRPVLGSCRCRKKKCETLEEIDTTAAAVGCHTHTHTHTPRTDPTLRYRKFRHKGLGLQRQLLNLSGKENLPPPTQPRGSDMFHRYNRRVRRPHSFPQYALCRRKLQGIKRALQRMIVPREPRKLAMEIDAFSFLVKCFVVDKVRAVEAIDIGLASAGDR